MLSGYIDYNEFKPEPIIPQKVGVDDVIEIFSKTETQATEVDYGYTEQKGIGQKPTLIATGEGLKKYSLPIKLHHSFCHPGQIIKDLELKAENCEIIDYFQQDNYIGKYVISKIAKNTIEQYLDTILCADLTVDLIEAPSKQDEEFKQQNKKKTQPTGELKKVETKPQKAVRNIVNKTQNFYETLTDNVLDTALRKADSYLNTVTNGVSGDIKNGVIDAIQPL
ncbi:MAG: hypothetical protein PHV37_01750 [Candidatus Gastranaerophilales bacterium]|nr:hypothetical protein [Candidatus Gastranaerophilales bacterium]